MSHNALELRDSQALYSPHVPADSLTHVGSSVYFWHYFYLITNIMGTPFLSGQTRLNNCPQITVSVQ